METKYKINESNALYPNLTVGELSPGQFMREYRHGRPDVVRDESKLSERTKSTKKMKLTEPMVRFIRINYKIIGKIKLAEMFSISTAFCYKVASKRAMEDVSDEGEVYEPGK